jgi:hypothetical protein
MENEISPSKEKSERKRWEVFEDTAKEAKRSS